REAFQGWFDEPHSRAGAAQFGLGRGPLQHGSPRVSESGPKVPRRAVPLVAPRPPRVVFCDEKPVGVNRRHGEALGECDALASGLAGLGELSKCDLEEGDLAPYHSAPAYPSKAFDALRFFPQEDEPTAEITNRVAQGRMRVTRHDLGTRGKA